MDNRYVLLPSDFPDPATLRARGIRRVVYVVEDRGRSTTEEDDFHEWRSPTRTPASPSRSSTWASSAA